MSKDTDPKHWKLGIFYYNPNNPSEIVDKRKGIGTTVNFASRRGRLMIWFLFIPLAVIIIALVFAGAFGR
jgi:Predicted membrane protein